MGVAVSVLAVLIIGSVYVMFGKSCKVLDCEFHTYICKT
jgi:hypothetical protein